MKNIGWRKKKRKSNCINVNNQGGFSSDDPGGMISMFVTLV
jgi:hypothetical protein